MEIKIEEHERIVNQIMQAFGIEGRYVYDATRSDRIKELEKKEVLLNKILELISKEELI